MKTPIIVKSTDDQKDKLYENLGELFKEELFSHSYIDKLPQNVDEYIITKDKKGDYNLKIKFYN